MSFQELYEKLLQNAGNENLQEKIKKASFYLDGRIDELQKNFNNFITENLEKYEKKTPYYTTQMITMDNITVNDREMLMELEGKGVINQIFCKSNSDDFGIFILLDNKIIFEKPYSYFQELQKHLQDIETYKIDDNYYLDMKKFGFIKSVRIYLTSTKQVIFNSIVIKYLLYESKE